MRARTDPNLVINRVSEVKPAPVVISGFEARTKALYAQAKLKPEKFAFGDVVLAKRSDVDGVHVARISIDLATVFADADVDNDGRLTFEEWRNHCGRWFEEAELRKLFDECDANGDGVLDLQEFTTGCANKYLIEWAQVGM